MKRAVLVVLPEGPEPNKQLTILTAYCAAHRLRVVSLLHGDPGTAVTLIQDGLVDVVVVACDDYKRSATTAVAAVVAAGGELLFCRAPRTRYGPTREINPAIERALARGLEPETVAEILDVSIDAVLEALAAQGTHGMSTPSDTHAPGRRAREVTRPAGRR